MAARKKKISLAYIRKLIASMSGSAVWGTITGTLSAQTDLDSALSGKVPSSRTISTTSPLTGGGDLSANRTLSLASGYGDTLNPYASKTANFFLAAPNGAGGVPSFRAIVPADIPTLNQNTTGSAGTLNPGKDINGELFTGASNIITDSGMKLVKKLGSIKKLFNPFDVVPFSNTGTNLANQTIYLLPVYCPNDDTISKINYNLLVAGVFVANNNNKMGIYSDDGAGTLTKIGQTANDATIFTGATQHRSANLSASVNVTGGEIYFIAILYCRSSVTTTPSIMKISPTTPQSGSFTQDFTNNTKFSATLGSQTDLPATILWSATSVNNANILWADAS